MVNVSATLLRPNDGTGRFEQSGIWFGIDEDNYIKLCVMSTPSGLVMHTLMEARSLFSLARYIF